MLIFAKRLRDFTADDILMMFGILIVLCLVMCVVAAILRGRQNAANDAQPLREMDATIIDKQQVAPNTVAFEVWVMFQTSDGNRVRVICKANNDYVIGDSGYLRWQGSRLISFQRGKTEEQVRANRICVQNQEMNYPSSPQPQGRIPAWMQVEMEKENKQ